MNTSASYISAAAQFSPGAPLGLVVQMMLDPIKHRPSRNITRPFKPDPDEEVVGPRYCKPGLIEANLVKRLARFAQMKGAGPMRPCEVHRMIGGNYDSVNKQLGRMAVAGLLVRSKSHEGDVLYEWI